MLCSDVRSSWWVLVVAMLGLPVRAASGSGLVHLEPMYDSLISSDTLAATCAKVLEKSGGVAVMGQGSPAVRKVRAYCELNASVSALETEWAAWETVPVPSPEEVATAAKEYKPQPPENLFSEPFDPSTRDFLDATGRSGSGTPIFNESAILWGLTDFVVDRIRSDVGELGLSAFVKKACQESLSIRVLLQSKSIHIGPLKGSADVGFPPLPRTCEVLEQSVAQIRTPALAALRSAVRGDLEQLPTGLTRYLALTFAGHTDSKVRDGFAVAYMSALIATSLTRDGLFLKAITVPLDSVSPSLFKLSCQDTPAASVLFQLAALARTLSSNTSLSGTREGRAKQIGFALKTLIINVQYSRLGEAWPAEGNCKTPTSHVGTRLTKVRDLFIVALSMNEAISAVQAATEGLRNTNSSNGETAESRIAYGRRVVDAAFELVNLVVTQQLGNSATPYIQIVGRTRETADALLRHEYGASLVAGLRMIDTLVGTAAFEKKNLQKIRPILTLVADVAEADNAEGVTEALKRNVAPRTSYLRKRADKETRGFGVGKVYFTVNAYAGGIAGQERLEATGSRKAFVAPFVPLGIEVGVPLHKWLSVGLFAHVIDIGALASYRINSEDSVDTAPNVTLRQVFSPGAAITVGLTRLPLTAGLLVIGASPRLRRIDSAGNITESDVTRRWAGFLAYDIRLF
jgi:hypothetical protein